MSSTLDVPAMPAVSINCKFGRVSFGVETVSMSVKCGRAAIPTDNGEPAIVRADQLLRNRRLNVLLTNQDDQGQLFEDQEGFEAVEVRCIVDTASLSSGDNFGVTMNAALADLTQQQQDDIQHLAQRAGRLVIFDVSSKPDKRQPHPDERDDDGDPDKQTAAGGTLFAAVKQASLDTEVANLEQDGKCPVTEKQAIALVQHGYGTVAAIVELRDSVGDGYREALATVPTMSKAAANRLADVVEYTLAKEAETTQDEPQPTGKTEFPRDGRLLCEDCGQLWDTFDENDTGNGIGEDAARELDRCPFCDSAKRPQIVRDDRVSDTGEFFMDACERIKICGLEGLLVEILLIEDEFRSWRHGVVITDTDRDEIIGGYDPGFEAVRRDRQAAIDHAKRESVRELGELEEKYAVASRTCQDAIRAAYSQK